MDPVSGAALVGVGYVAYLQTAKKPAQTQPESVGPVITSKAPLPARNLREGGLGGLLGAGVSDLFLDVTAGYNAPTTKAVAVPLLTGIAVVGVAVTFVAIGYAGIAVGGYVGLIVVAVLVIVFAVLVISANVEDVDRWNRYVSFKQQVVKAASAGNFRLAMNIAVEGARQQVSSLGFYLKEEPTVYETNTLYYKTAFDTTPAIVDPLHSGGVFGRGGLDKDYFLPALKRYDYTTYFGVDGAHMATLSNGGTVNLIAVLSQFRDAQQFVYDKCCEILKRPPTIEEWLNTVDASKDANGTSMRDVIRAHDAFGAAIQPSVPWLDTWLLQSIDFPMSFLTSTGYVTRPWNNLSSGHTKSTREAAADIRNVASFTVSPY